MRVNDYTKLGADKSTLPVKHLCRYFVTHIKTDENICRIISKSAAHFPIVLKIGRLMS